MPPIANAADLAHIHLVLNHVPTIGTVLSLGLLLLAFLRRDEHLKKVSFEVIFFIALITMPVYVSGNAAAEVLAAEESPAMSAIARHNDAALASFVLMQFSGFFAWLGLWRIRRMGRLTTGICYTVIVFTVLTVVAVSYAANLGGDIRHPEIANGQYAGAIGGSGSSLPSVAAIRSYVLRQPNIWPAAETLHFLGMSLMFGVLMAVNLRLVGWLREMSFESLHRLLPLGMVGFAINYLTGMFFFVAASEQYTQNVSFHWKILLMMLVGINYLVLTVYDKTWTIPASQEAPLTGKFLGASALVLAIAVMYFGRMLPFIGDAF